MQRELTWGAATAVAIVAAVGISSQPGSKPQETAAGARESGRAAIHSKATRNGADSPCSDLADLFARFLLREVKTPEVCGIPAPDAGKQPTGFQPTFIIATLPDPLHTHFSLLFDRFTEAIQEGAQDEGYDYDDSWMPWEMEEPSLTKLSDLDKSDERTEAREEQPGVLVFRNSNLPGQPQAQGDSNSPDQPYNQGLVIFVVGEESTRGIHRQQFENAVAWIDALRTAHGDAPASVAILGPTFSGSFPSLAQLLADASIKPVLGRKPQTPMLIYSGSASSGDAGRSFATQTAGIDFRSFVQDDDTELNRFCRYLKRSTESLDRLAILSEDETAYGGSGQSKDQPEDENPCNGATYLYYPRDISTLRAAYQKQSMFNNPTAQPGQSTPQRSLPTDLADPAEKEHDTVQSYAGNQTPLSQEAQLLGIVEALRVHRADYIVLRSSNNLDPLFLANFLRREYPDAREVILNSDLLFQRGKDALALNGVMTLSAYPMFGMGREWTARETNGHSHRVFPENSAEATYIATRMLTESLTDSALQPDSYSCKILASEEVDKGKSVFTPPMQCLAGSDKPYVELPDYAPPFWTVSQPAAVRTSCEPWRPATWLSVITRNGSWPLAAFNDDTFPQEDDRHDCSLTAMKGISAQPATPDAAQWPMPKSMKLLLLVVIGCAAFHWWCCWSASFTRKPAFLAHFAGQGRAHRRLIVMGSSVIAVSALFTGWGGGAFAWNPALPWNAWTVWVTAVAVCFVCALSTWTNLCVTERLGRSATPENSTKKISPSRWRRTSRSLATFAVVIALFVIFWVCVMSPALIPATRVFVFWRSMHLTSGVSPIIPYLFLALGLYCWFWYSLHGLALFGPDRPRLPLRSEVTAELPLAKGSDGQSMAQDDERDRKIELSMFSQQLAAMPAEEASKPFSRDSLQLFAGLFVFFLIAGLAMAKHIPIRSLGASWRYAVILCVCLDVYFSLILTEAVKIWQTWARVRQLLGFLDRLALRRTFSALRGFSWGNVWRMSGNVLDVRYKLVSRQLECLNHLSNSLQKFIDEHPSDPAKTLGASLCLITVSRCRDEGRAFGQWYTKIYNEPKGGGWKHFTRFQRQVAKTSGKVLIHLLLPEWREEHHSLILVDPSSAEGDNEVDDRKQAPLSAKPHIRNAEEFVCLTYLGFAQNVLGRIRTIVLGGSCLFVAATVAIASYPFDPRPLLSGALFVLFVAYGAVVVFVYADMHRDATLSHVTNKNPGELGSEFWFKLLAIGAAPLLGLLTTIFPEWTGSIFTWLEPGISSLK
jgi:hypothetical protein